MNLEEENMLKDMVVCYLARKLEINMEKKMDTATKTEIDIAKAAPKRVVQKTAVATGDLIQNTIANKITLAGRTRSKEKKMKQMK